MAILVPINFVCKFVFAVRQTVMFSATWPLPVHQLAQEFMDPNPIKVWIFMIEQYGLLIYMCKLATMISSLSGCYRFRGFSCQSWCYADNWGMDSQFGFGYFFRHHLSSVGFTLFPLQVLDDRSRDERLVTLLQKYHSSKRYSIFFIHTLVFLNLVLWSFILNLILLCWASFYYYFLSMCKANRNLVQIVYLYGLAIAMTSCTIWYGRFFHLSVTGYWSLSCTRMKLLV